MTMSIERATELVELCNLHVFHSMGIVDEQPQTLQDVSLADLVEANRLVRESPDLTMVHCDDRITAAIYVAYHYRGDDISAVEPVVTVGRRAVAVLDIGSISPTDESHGTQFPTQSRPTLVECQAGREGVSQ